MSLRILHTESSWGWGGQELRILTESAALAERGHQLCIAAPPDTPILQRAAQMGLETLALPIRKKTWGGWHAMRALLAKRQFDVVNTHSSTDSWLVALAVLGLSRRPALVRTRHVSTPVRADWANRWLYGRATKRVVGTGEAVCQALVGQLGLSASHVVSVPTGISSEQFRPPSPVEKAALRAKLGFPPGQTVFGCVATLRMLKGVDYLFRALHQLRSLPVHLVVVGDGPQMANLQALRRELNLQDKVTMVGEQSKVEQWLQAMDAFIFPSLAEGVPQALAQAMLSALPCVCTDVGGIPELASHMRTAWVCPPRDADALAQGMQALLNDESLRISLGQAAREHCVQTRSVGQMADAMERVFEDALRDHRAGHAD